MNYNITGVERNLFKTLAKAGRVQLTRLLERPEVIDASQVAIVTLTPLPNFSPDSHYQTVC